MLDNTIQLSTTNSRSMSSHTLAILSVMFPLVSWHDMFVVEKVYAASNIEHETAKSSEFADGEMKLIRQFESKKFHFTGSWYQNQLFAYRIYLPSESPENGRFPLLLWLHGYGQAGNENMLQVMHIDKALYDWQRQKAEFPAIILVPQCPGDNPLWFESHTSQVDIVRDEPLTIAWVLLQQAMREFPIDEDRIYLAGVSSGGTACFEMVMRYPHRFAGVVPMAFASGDNSRVKLLSSTPIWAFHSKSDPGIPASENRHFITAARREGCPAGLTEIPSKNHDCWTAAFEDYGVLEWLLAQRRGQKNTLIPGSSFQFSWSLVTPIGVLFLICISIRAEILRRRRTNPTQASTQQME